VERLASRRSYRFASTPTNLAPDRSSPGSSLRSVGARWLLLTLILLGCQAADQSSGPPEIGAVPGGELTQPATKPGQLAESGGAAPSAQRKVERRTPAPAASPQQDSLSPLQGAASPANNGTSAADRGMNPNDVTAPKVSVTEAATEPGSSADTLRELIRPRSGFHPIDNPVGEKTAWRARTGEPVRWPEVQMPLELEIKIPSGSEGSKQEAKTQKDRGSGSWLDGLRWLVPF
jgi:hypothetical protein